MERERWRGKKRGWGGEGSGCPSHEVVVDTLAVLGQLAAWAPCHLGRLGMHFTVAVRCGLPSHGSHLSLACFLVARPAIPGTQIV